MNVKLIELLVRKETHCPRTVNVHGENILHMLSKGWDLGCMSEIVSGLVQRVSWFLILSYHMYHTSYPVIEIGTYRVAGRYSPCEMVNFCAIWFVILLTKTSRRFRLWEQCMKSTLQSSIYRYLCMSPLWYMASWSIGPESRALQICSISINIYVCLCLKAKLLEIVCVCYLMCLWCFRHPRQWLSWLREETNLD